MTGKSTVRSVTYDLLRALGLTTVFGNPGSTEETFLQEFPGDFRYVLALQEASAIAMADAFAQVTRRPALVNLHSSAGVGNAMGNLVAAYPGNNPLAGPAGVRSVSSRFAPDGERLRQFADRISASRRPALVFGPEVDRSGGWDVAVALAEKLRAAVYGAPLQDRASFPEDHPLFGGPLGMSVKTISDRLAGHDLAVVIGAEGFRYYPYVPGDLLPAGTELLQITASPDAAASARVGDALLADPRIAIELLLALVAEGGA